MQFPYENWEGLIKHSQGVKMTESRPHYEPIQPLPFVKPNAIQQKRMENVLYKRRKLEAKKTGIPHKAKNKGGHPRSPRPTIQSINVLRGYK